MTPEDPATTGAPDSADRGHELARIPAVRAAVMASMTLDDVHAVMERLGHMECECLWRREQDQAWKQAASERAAAVSTLPSYGQRWTQDQLAVLREPWLTDEECARILGRTVCGIDSARQVYNVARGYDLRKDEDYHPERQRALRKYAGQLVERPEAIP